MVITAIFTALLLLEIFIPNLGNIHLFPGLPAITTIPLTVAVFANLQSYQSSFWFGALWGLLSLLMAYLAPGDLVTVILFQNPLIAVLPRALAGLSAGIIAKKSGYIYQFLSGALASLMNTGLVILLASVFYQNNSTLLNHLKAGPSASLFIILISSLALNGILELIFSAVLTPLLVTPLKQILIKKK